MSNRFSASVAITQGGICQVFHGTQFDLSMILSCLRNLHHVPCPVTKSHPLVSVLRNNTGRSLAPYSQQVISTCSQTSSICPSMSIEPISTSKVLVLMADRSGGRGYSQDRVQSFLWRTSQQGDTFVPGKESRQGRANRVNSAIQAIHNHFPNPSVAQQQGHSSGAQGTSRNRTNADLNGVGQQFYGTHR